MSALLLLALALQVRTGTPDSARADSARDRSHATLAAPQRAPRRVAVTAEHLRTAFRTAAAERALRRARAARMQQDSSLVSYEANTLLRISAGLGFSRIGRDRLLFRHENATRVRWHRDVGVWVDVKGARTHLPGEPDHAAEHGGHIAGSLDVGMLPYYPGQEPLLSFSSDIVKASVDERDMVHPLAEGAEAYYTYAAGDSMIFRLPDGSSIRLHELLVRPRESRWNVAVGSLWFDAASGQLVRAAYRLAVPMDIWAMVKQEEPEDYEEIPVWVRPMLSPMRVQITYVGVEYGLYAGRFWLPRVRSARGSAQVSFMRVPVEFEQGFRYASVNGLDSLPAIVVAPQLEPPDSLAERQRRVWRDSVRVAQRRARRDSIRNGLLDANAECDSTGARLVTRLDEDSRMRIAVRVPCDRHALATAPELPASLYDEGEELFGSAELEALKRQALSLGAQPPLAIGLLPPTVRWGLEFTRFNRIEGLSTAVLLEQRLGGGYATTLLARIGHADLVANGELAVSRSNMTHTVRARTYHRLVAANDWGNPLSFGSSVAAFLFGRDDGFYYRAAGAELEWAREDRPTWSYRLFAEQHREARPENEFSLGARFIPNIRARRGNYAGGAVRFVNARGLDPDGFRVFSDLRLEGAVRDSAGGSYYGRGALDMTLVQGFSGGAVAVTLAGGSSAGQLPVQRRWYLGGAHTVRGQRADTAAGGSAFWLSRLEVGRGMKAVRPVVFGDIGWAGPRDRLAEAGRPMSGVGAGLSALDGLVRVDVARGVHPSRRVRVDMYLDARF